MKQGWNPPALRALAWEQWRVFRFYMAALVVMGACGVIGLRVNVARGSVHLNEAIYLSDALRLWFTLIIPAALTFAGSNGKFGFPTRLYKLPVATRAMTLALFGSRAVLGLAAWCALLGVRGVCFGAPDWAVEARMLLSGGGVFIAALALVWTLGPVSEWLAFFAVAVAGSVVWPLNQWAESLHKARHAGFWVGPDLVLPVLGILLTVLFALLFAAPDRWRAGRFGLRMPRAGGSAPAPRITAKTRRLKPFASPLEAQIWYERRTRGHAGMLYGFLLITLIIVAFVSPRLWFALFPGEAFGNAFFFYLLLNLGTMALAACLVVTAIRRLMELSRVRRGHFRFVAVKPVSTGDLARARLYSSVRGAEAAALFVLALLALLMLTPPKPVLLSPEIWPLWLSEAYQALTPAIVLWGALWLLGLWIAASMNTHSSIRVIGVLCVWPLLQLLKTYAPVDWLARHGLEWALAFGCAAGLLAYVAALFLRARRRGFLSPVTGLLCLAVFALAGMAFFKPLIGWVTSSFGHSAHVALNNPTVSEISFYSDNKTFLPWEYPMATLIVFSLLALALAPVAALPLQYDRWRHGGK